MKRASWVALVVVAQGFGSIAVADGWDPDTNADNLVSGGIENTRHNMSMSYLSGAHRATMLVWRNDYGEVCVYCHTPHGANTTSGAGMPLWNRTVNPSLTYQLFVDARATTLQLAGNQSTSDPGPASLTCLSCHDGVTAVDSVINMPGSGNYQASQRETVDPSFLAGWSAGTFENLGLAGCARECHNPGGSPFNFYPFVIGGGTDADGNYVSPEGTTTIDLRDDHPTGVLYPTATAGARGVDFRPMDVLIPGKYAFFDGNGNGRADKYEVRAYDSGQGYEVECASCHDPHGVPDAANIEFIPSFLRVDNTGSALCLTCHDK